MTAAKRSEGAYMGCAQLPNHVGGNSQNGRWPSSFRAQSRPPEAGSRNQRVGRLELPVFGLAASFARSTCQASYWGVPGRGGAPGGNPPIQCGMSATWGPPAQPETNRLRVQSLRTVRSTGGILRAADGIDFLTYQLSTSVGGSGPRGEPWSHRAVDAPHGIRAIMARPRWLRTTDSRHDFPIAPNLLERNFTAAAPNRIWLADVTYIETD
jgi:hypothetical protein